MAVVSVRGAIRSLDRAKSWTNYLCDRIIDRCDAILTDYKGAGPVWLLPLLKRLPGRSAT